MRPSTPHIQIMLYLTSEQIRGIYAQRRARAEEKGRLFEQIWGPFIIAQQTPNTIESPLLRLPPTLPPIHKMRQPLKKMWDWNHFSTCIHQDIQMAMILHQDIQMAFQGVHLLPSLPNRAPTQLRVHRYDFSQPSSPHKKSTTLSKKCGLADTRRES